MRPQAIPIASRECRSSHQPKAASGRSGSALNADRPLASMAVVIAMAASTTRSAVRSQTGFQAFAFLPRRRFRSSSTRRNTRSGSRCRPQPVSGRRGRHPRLRFERSAKYSTMPTKTPIRPLFSEPARLLRGVEVRLRRQLDALLERRDALAVAQFRALHSSRGARRRSRRSRRQRRTRSRRSGSAGPSGLLQWAYSLGQMPNSRLRIRQTGREPSRGFRPPPGTPRPR